MKIESKPLRVLAMIGIGTILSIMLMLLECSQHLAAVLTGGLLFFVWPWLGGKW